MSLVTVMMWQPMASAWMMFSSSRGLAQISSDRGAAFRISTHSDMIGTGSRPVSAIRPAKTETHDGAPSLILDDPVGGGSERWNAHEQPSRLLLGIAVIDEKTAAAGALTRFDVAPTVADHERTLQLHAVSLRCIDQRARLRLAAVAGVA